MRSVLLLFFTLLFISLPAYAQKSTSRFALGFNPFGLAESQMFLGPAASYRFSPRYEAWGELSAVLRNNYMPKYWTDMRGYRLILQGRRYSKNDQRNFIATEFRLKNFSSNDHRDFVNSSTADTLYNFPYRQNQTLIGGAIVFGKRTFLDKAHNFYLEFTLGFGIKQRFTKPKNISPGYHFKIEEEVSGGPGLSIKYDDVALPYLPMGLRLMWVL